jgi:hypothetical protein
MRRAAYACKVRTAIAEYRVRHVYPSYVIAPGDLTHRRPGGSPERNGGIITITATEPLEAVADVRLRKAAMTRPPGDAETAPASADRGRARLP